MTYACVTCESDCTNPTQSRSSHMNWQAHLAVPPDGRGEWWSWLHGPRDQALPAWWGRSRDRGAA